MAAHQFLEKTARFILDIKPEDLRSTAVILPNRRSQVFLREHLKRMAEQTTWLPRIQTVDEFMTSVTGLYEKEPLHLYFDLFDIHQKIAGGDARPVEEFLSWAPIMLTDFNDIDLYLADAQKVFDHLSEAKALAEWNLDRKPLTELQVNYLAFYNSLIDYYKKLNQQLILEKAGYTGMIYRTLAEHPEKYLDLYPADKYIIAGFNALSEAEKMVFDHLHKKYDTTFLWDLDEYFFSEGGKLGAGRFLKPVVEKWKGDSIHWIDDELTAGEPKEIDIVEVSKRIGQVKYAGELLKIGLAENAFAQEGDIANTAVVLADEKLLTPLLNSLPVIPEGNKITGYNITMGFPLSGSPFSQLYRDWLDLCLYRSEHPREYVPVRYLISILNNPVIQLLAAHFKPPGTKQLTGELHSGAAVYLNRNDLISMVRKTGHGGMMTLIEWILPQKTSAISFIDSSGGLLRYFKEIIDQHEIDNVILKEQLVSMTQMMKQLHLLLLQNQQNTSLKALQRIINQLLRRAQINLRGEPLSGIQIMGMLETRNLDFENIIMVGANEGILPKTDTLESFIPFDIRAVYRLPLPKDKTDVFAYHFFRLLRQARKLTIMYNAVPDELGGGEMSRFLLQLKHELAVLNPRIKIRSRVLKTELHEEVYRDEIDIPKTEDVLQLIRDKMAKGLSPSSLSTYINCPLQFYFSYLLGLKPSDELQEEVEANVFGNVIHGTLEMLYQGFKDHIDTAVLRERLKKVDSLLEQQFSAHYRGGDLKSGKNLLIARVARKYIERFVELDIDDLDKKPRSILVLEDMLHTKVETSVECKLKGKIDRIDRSPGDEEIRLIDYKTGSVEPRDLALKSWDELTTDPKHAKVFQLLFYAYLFKRNFPEKENLVPGIFSLRKLSRGLQHLKLPDDSDLSAGIEEFEKQLKVLINELFDKDVPITQTPDHDRCTWCDYKNICNRSGGNQAW